jgi:hypothetical protein
MPMHLMSGQHYRERESGIGRVLPTLITLLICLAAAPSLLAHHGLARFDTTHIVSMQGTVTGFKWINPHAYVYADVKG